jgi:hypothetical protein
MAQEAAIHPAGGTIMGPHPQPGRREPAESPSRALVNVSPTARHEPTHRPGAAFLAQLIACDRKMPQMRERRRAEPQEAAAVYAQGNSIAPAGRMLSRLA